MSSLTEQEHLSMKEARMRLHMSAKRAMYFDHTAEEWMSSNDIKNFAAKYMLEDELVHIVAMTWQEKEKEDPNKIFIDLE